jgi:hypothetical protein
MSNPLIRNINTLTLCVGLVSTIGMASDHVVLVGRWDDGGRGHVRAVAQSGRTAYIGVGRNFEIVDVSDRTHPALVSRLELPPYQEILEIAAVGSHAYVVTGNGLLVVDVSIPASPVVVCSRDLEETAYRPKVVLSGERLYVTGLASGRARIVDISDPNAPEQVGSIDNCGSIAVDGPRAYCAGQVSGTEGLIVLNVSNPATPTIIGTSPFRPTFHDIRHLAVQGSFVYACGAWSLLTVDVSNATAPSVASELVWNAGPRADTWGMSVSGPKVFFAYSSYSPDISGLFVVDVSNPAAPAVLANHTGRYPTDLASSGSYIYLGIGRFPERGEESGLFVVDVSDVSNPTEVGAYLTPTGTTGAVTVVGSRAFVIDGKQALRVLEVGQPAAPVEIGFLGFTDVSGWDASITRSTVSDARAYVAAGLAGLRVVDVSDPSAPVEVGALDTPGEALDVAVSGSRAYVADWTGGLRIVDVSDPTAPVEVGAYNPYRAVHRPYLFLGVAVHGSYAFLVDGGGPPQVVDVSNPAAPVKVGEIPIGGVNRIAIGADGRHAYTATFSSPSGLTVFDVSDPTAPAQVGLFETRDVQSYDFAFSGSLAWLLRGGGVTLVDVSDPSAPVAVGSYDLPGGRYVAADGDRAYVSADFDGVYVVARDTDDDGVGDPTDACLISDRRPTVELGVCDSGVENALLDRGCTIADRISVCGEARPRTTPPSCVARVLGQLTGEGAISSTERGRIQRCAGQTR